MSVANWLQNSTAIRAQFTSQPPPLPEESVPQHLAIHIQLSASTLHINRSIVGYVSTEPMAYALCCPSLGDTALQDLSGLLQWTLLQLLCAKMSIDSCETSQPLRERSWRQEERGVLSHLKQGSVSSKASKCMIVRRPSCLIGSHGHTEPATTKKQRDDAGYTDKRRAKALTATQ